MYILYSIISSGNIVLSSMNPTFVFTLLKKRIIFNSLTKIIAYLCYIYINIVLMLYINYNRLILEYSRLSIVHIDRDTAVQQG